MSNRPRLKGVKKGRHKTSSGPRNRKKRKPSKESVEESKCLRCGKCCMLDGEICVNLIKEGDRYACRIYGEHSGIRQTKSGKWFKCGPITARKELPEGCSYRRGQ